MPPKKTATKRKSNQRSKSRSPAPPVKRGTKKVAAVAEKLSSPTSTSTSLPSAGLLLTCDPPTKQYIKRLDDLKTNDKKFIIEDLDETHLLVKEKARDEILRKVEDWMNEVSWLAIFEQINCFILNKIYIPLSFQIECLD